MDSQASSMPEKCASELNDWHHGDGWNPTDIVSNIALPAYDEYYDINYPFYRDAFVLGHVTSPNTNTLSMNEISTPKVRSIKRKQHPCFA